MTSKKILAAVFFAVILLFPVVTLFLPKQSFSEDVYKRQCGSGLTLFIFVALWLLLL